MNIQYPIAELRPQAQHAIDSPRSASAPISKQRIIKAGGEPRRRLSFPQQRLWFLDRLEPDTPLYNIVYALRLRGRLNIAALDWSLNEIVRRHEILRTTFYSNEDGPVQVVAPLGKIALAMTDLASLPAEQREQEFQRHATEKARRPFDLESGPLFRARLVRMGEDDHALLLGFHHIVFDNWSEKIFGEELAAHYEAYGTGSSATIPELPIQYADYAKWESDRLDGANVGSGLQYWKTKLAGLPDSLELPTDQAPPPVRTLRGETVTELLDPSTTQTVLRLGGTKESLFTVLLAAFKVLLFRYSGQEDITVGVPTAKRWPETERLIGFFTNTLPVRDDLSGNPTFRDLLQRVRQTADEASAHADTPFEKLVEVLRPDRGLSRNPLFRVMFVFQESPFLRLRLPGMEADAEEYFSGTAKFDLTLFITESADSLRLRIEYSTDLFEAATIHRMLSHYRRLLRSAAARPDARLSELELLDAAECRQLLVDWNKTEARYAQDQCIHHLVEEQVERSPDEVAAVFGPEQLTYRELNTQATQLAAYLRSLGIGPDSRVGLCVERSVEMLVGALGILKSGGCYVPLDPNYPTDRLGFMLKDSAATVLLTQRRLQAQLPKTDAKIVLLDEPLPTAVAEILPRPIKVTPDHLAYVIYTSGSTGRPKGVAMPHRALVNLIGWQLKNSRAGRGSRTAQFTSLSFDVSFQEIFSTWCSGGTLVLVPQSIRRDSHALWKLLADARVERLFLPFVALQQLAEAAVENDLIPRHLREVVTAGEQLQVTKEIVTMFEHLPGCTLHNHYGPTESHVVTAHTLAGAARSWPMLPPIGRPISNTRIYLLDIHSQPVPIGVPGELYIGGTCVARGYLDQPELTEKKFVHDPFSHLPNARLYRTGDSARYRPDGSIEFLGRLDHQVKLRGFRVELGEIEDALRRHKDVRDSVVVAREIAPGDKRLIAYLTLKDSVSPTPAELREHVRALLPDYMVPASFIPLEKLPLTPSGKIDRKSLLELGGDRVQQSERPTPPRSPVEQTLASIWCDVLKRKDVGIHDNFFDLGGHSLLAMQVIDHVHKAGLGLSLNQLFQFQTIAELAEIADTNQTVSPGSEEWFSLVTLQPKGTKPPLFLIHTAPGDLLGYMKLVYHLGSDQPCYGFQSFGLLRQDEAHQRLEDMAAHYVRLLREFQPEGPYCLAGWCFGGNVAMEMAWQLADQGQHTALIGVIEGWAHPPLPTYWRYYAHRAVGLLKRGPHGVLRRYWGKVSRVFGRGDEAQERKAEFAFEAVETGPLVNREQVYQINLRATNDYRSRPAMYPGRVTLFVRKDFGDGDIISPDCGFATLARETKTYLIPGDHMSVLKEPHVKTLAARLKEALADGLAASKSGSGGGANRPTG